MSKISNTTLLEILENRMNALTELQVYAAEVLEHEGNGFQKNQKNGLLRSVTGLDIIKNRPEVIDLSLKYPQGSEIHGANEECFLVTCWSRPETPQNARNLYKLACQSIQFDIS